jgi:hypothetical protein
MLQVAHCRRGQHISQLLREKDPASVLRGLAVASRSSAPSRLRTGRHRKGLRLQRVIHANHVSDPCVVVEECGRPRQQRRRDPDEPLQDGRDLPLIGSASADGRKARFLRKAARHGVGATRAMRSIEDVSSQLPVVFVVRRRLLRPAERVGLIVNDLEPDFVIGAWLVGMQMLVLYVNEVQSTLVIEAPYLSQIPGRSMKPGIDVRDIVRLSRKLTHYAQAFGGRSYRLF